MATKKQEIQSFIRSLPILAGVLGRKLGVTIQIGGSIASTDGKTISLPALPLEGGEELFILANGFIDHEAAHVRMTDFDELRAAELTPLSHLLSNLVEDLRVERELVTIYPGCLNHFKKLYGELVKDTAPEDAAKASQNITGWLMSAIFKEQYPDVEFPVQVFREAVDDQFPKLASQLEAFMLPGLACASTAESIAWGKSVEAFLAQYFAQSKPKPAEQDSPQEEPQAENDEEGDSSSSHDSGVDSDAQGDDDSGADVNPASQDDAVPSDENGQPDDDGTDEHPGDQKSQCTGDDAPDADASGDGAEPDTNGTTSDAGSSTDASGDEPGAGNGAPVAGTEPENGAGQPCPENDPHTGTASLSFPQSDGSDMSPDSSGMDMLERMIQGDAAQELEEAARESLAAMVKSEGEMPRSFGDLLKDLLEQASENGDGNCLQVAVIKGELPPEMPRHLIEYAQSATKVMATRLSGLLQTQTLSRTHTSRRGRVDGNRLHRLAVENPRVFKQPAERHSIHTAVHILLDCSESMDRCMSLANAACYSVASALHRIRGVNVGVTAFPGEWDWEQTDTVSPILKHGQRMHTRFAARAYGSTPMGEALWWACQQMMALKEDRKIILVLTDGYPDSFQNTNAALDAARKLGFETIGIGIGEHGAFIRNLIANSRVINDIQELAPAMFGVLQQALTEKG